ncbi:MAG: lysoplasmalogenase [Candidatus Binatia bacterium]|nr:lysoplasmalogenase [Candidatus Binatia bacterium]
MPTATDPSLYALVTVLTTAGLVLCDRFGSRLGRGILKPIAATGFVLTAWAAGALDSTYGQWIFLGLLLSWVGDVALLARESPGLFKLGLVSFLLGHVAYSVGFVARGISADAALGAAAALSIPAVIALRWLTPHVSDSMKTPVRAYVVVITLMVLLAIATVAHAGNPWILVGAVLFYLSDLAVARERFVVRSFWNGAWGSPMYFVGQVVLALTVRP